jgi:lipoate-protein ligase A
MSMAAPEPGVSTAGRSAARHQEDTAAGRATWHDYEWQLIHEPPRTPLMHMALDAVLADEVAAGHRAPTLRFWEWAAPAVVIGRFQSVKNEVDPEGARRYGIQVVRRVSGGGAMFIEPGNTITYSLYAPLAMVQGLSFQESYALLDDWVLQALRSLGIDAHYQPLNDIASSNGKIGGAAQARRGTAVLHHATMAYDIDADKMLQVLRIGREKLSDKGIASAGKRVDPLRSQTGLQREQIIARMIDTFAALYGLAPGAVSPAEEEQAEALARTRFASDEWMNQVP